MADLQSLAALLNPGDLSVEADILAQYGRDWTRFATPAPIAVAFPRSTEQVQAIVRWARSAKVGIVPSGGRTGLSGGAVAAKHELVVSFAKMNRILEVSTSDSTVRVEAGVVLEQLQSWAKEHGYFYPVDFAARGSCAIGGNIATNAGGIKVLRYGMTREHIVGLTVVTGAGDVLELGKSLVKNATGYDLKHLFIGSEGTLGLVTHATIKLAKPPPPQTVMVLGVNALADVMKLFEKLRNTVTLSAFELFSDIALELVTSKGHAPKPFATPAKWYVLAEFDADGRDRALEVLEDVVDGVMSESSQQAAQLWALRENITESASAYTPYKNDISTKVSDVPAFLAEVDTIISSAYPGYRVLWFGHVGDGNMHINILKPEGVDFKEFYANCQRVDQDVFAVVQKHSGSISAEHGVGLVKRPFLSFSRAPEEIAIMRGVKNVLDPDGIMNPGKLL